MCIRDRLWGFGGRAELAACAPVALVASVAELPAAVAALDLSLIHISEPTRPY